LIKKEMVRRSDLRRIEHKPWPSWQSEAKSLAEWAELSITHGNPPKASTIERELRAFYNELKAAPPAEKAGN
jgi:hypothetical protein